jgi:NAD(P)-dependent dehydrogenase (short-subunit alcohol dehydrogenase family)
VVTGGAAGIGAGIAQRLAAEGMHVVIADLDQAGQATAAGIGGSFVRADVATSAGVRTAIDAGRRAAGRVGVLVNNAGGIEGPCFPAAGPAKWEHTLDLNLRAVMLATQLVLGPMAERGGGAIINVASVAGLGTTSHDAPEYAVAKAGVIRFTACLAPLRETMGVRANCICPGLVDTPSSRRSRARMTPAELAADPDSRRHSGRRDDVSRRRHPGRTGHGLPRWCTRPPAPAHRLADRVTLGECGGGRAG